MSPMCPFIGGLLTYYNNTAVYGMLFPGPSTHFKILNPLNVRGCINLEPSDRHCIVDEEAETYYMYRLHKVYQSTHRMFVIHVYLHTLSQKNEVTHPSHWKVRVKKGTYL